MDYLPRVIDKQVQNTLQTFGAVCIEGAKWCGKTWTSRHHTQSEVFLGDPAGNFQNKRLAELSPDLILQGDNPRLIDEWQEVPALWDAVRYEVDQRGKKGQFILTGSSTPVQKGILHSGAGRIASIRMRPMSLFESRDSSGEVSLEGLFQGNFTQAVVKQESLEFIAKLIVRGGWPGSLAVDSTQYPRITKQYLEALINHDIYRLEGINRDTRKMHLLLRSLARNEGTSASLKKLRSDIAEYEGEEIDQNTINTYLGLFERLFLIENQKAFTTNIRSSVRVKQSDKRHFVDPSLAAALLEIDQEGLLHDLNTMGFLFEALCERDLRIYAESFGASLSHYQDYAGREIDAVVELPGGRWGAFEIKLGANQIDEAAKSLLKLRDKLEADQANTPDVLAVICGLSYAAYQRHDGVYPIPITALAP